MQSDQGYPLMMLVAMHEDSEFLQLALRHRGDPNFVDYRTAKTPIFSSIGALRPNNVRLLIEAGANLNFQDRTGSAPVMSAAAINQYHFVYAMLKAGADPTIKNNWGNTLLYFIKDSTVSPKHELFQWRQRVIELLNERGLSVD